MIQLKAIRRALRSGSRFTTIVGLSLVSAALIVSRIQKPVTSSPVVSEETRLVAPVAVAPFVDAPVVAQAAPVKSAALVVAKSHSVRLKAVEAHKTHRQNPTPEPKPESVVVAESEEDEAETEGVDDEDLLALEKLMAEEFEETVVAVNPTELSESVAETLLDEEFEVSAAVNLPIKEVALAPVQGEGELQLSDFALYSTNFTQMKLDLEVAKAELAGESDAKDEKPIVADKPADMEKVSPSVEPTLVVRALAVAAEVPLNPIAQIAPTRVEVDEPVLAKVDPQAAVDTADGEVIAEEKAAPLAADTVNETTEPMLVRPVERDPAVPAAKVAAAPVARATRSIVQAGLGIHRTLATQPVVAPPSKRVLDTREELSAIAHSDVASPLVASRSGEPSITISDSPAAAPELTTRRIAPRPPPAPEPEDDEQIDELANGGNGFGVLELEPKLARWLNSKKGHVELYLNPVKGKNPADTIFLDYSFPDEDFEFSTEGLRGNYRLVAGLFVPEAATAVAQIAFPKNISATNYKQRVRFLLKYADFEKARQWQNSRATGLSMTITVFEGATGDYREPKPIRQAKVSIEGFPELGTFRADSEGNVRIPQVPAHSTLKIHAIADGYYDTHVVIPTGSGQVYSPVFLISKEKVDTVTKYFTKSPQDISKGIVMGRVFHPKTRTPLAEEVISLQYRRGKALYFDSLPDATLRSTTKTGLFGFYNVTAAFRTLSRESSDIPFLFNVPPSSALYVELGRGGEKNLKGKLVAPFASHVPSAQVRLVGMDSEAAVITDSLGRFVIPKLDFPAGSLLLEVQAAGYPVLWYDIPWNPRDPEKTRSLFMIESELVTESATRLAKLKWKNHLGALVGGASGDFFKNRKECISVTLDEVSGKLLASEFGPFPLSGESFDKGKKLCLSPSRPGFTFFNLQPGEYVLKWRNEKGATIRSRVVRVGLGRVSIAVE